MPREHDELERELRSFEEIVKLRLPRAETGRRVAVALRELYGIRAASRLMRCFRELCREEIGTALEVHREDDPFTLGSYLPTCGAIQNATPKLIKSIESKDWNQAVVALIEMEIPTLCCNPGQMFDRLEFVVGLTIGRARLVPLVELALFASEVGAYEKAERYVADAHSLAPEPPELHDLYTVDGIICLAADQVVSAMRYLAKSVEACGIDESARVTCGIRPFNLILAEKLLARGEKASVLAYLDRCKHVWSYEGKYITAWIESIKLDQKPNFFVSGIRNVLCKPATRIRDLVLRSTFLDERPDGEIGVDVSDVRAQFKKDVVAALKGNLNQSKN
jgi:hypothetical protein